ncbi:MAG: hypothetical protein ACETVY_00755 [Candidatus Bathyarchaeia archaeon]
MERRLPTGCAPLDETLGGGFRFGDVSLIYGEASTGKTTLALSCVASHLRNYRWAKAYYVDSDQKLSTKRLTQVAGGGVESLERLMVWSPRGFFEQTDVIEGLLDLIPERAPVVVDSITGAYRLEAGDASRTFVINKELNRQLGFLSETAKAKDAAVIVIGQVHAIMNSETPQVEPVAKRLLEYWSDCVLKLEMTPISGVRQAVLEKPGGSIRGYRFRLGEAGLEEVDRLW